MSKVEIHGSAQPHETAVRIDGREISGLYAITVHADVHDISKVELKAHVLNSLDIVIEADVSLTLHVLPGYDLVVSHPPDGSTRYRAERIEPIAHDKDA